MSHQHGRITLSEADLPERIGASVTFWERGDQFSLRRDRADMWMLHSIRHRTATPLVTLHPIGDEWQVLDVNGDEYRERRFPDWRTALRSAL